MHRIPQSLIDSLTSGPTPTKTTQVANMHNYIQELLSGTHHTFLQGSYKNDTAVSDINDVDVVAIRLDTYSGTHSTQPVTSTIFWNQIFSEIEAKLRNQTRYTWTVERSDKCIKVRGAFNADVVPAVKVGTDHFEDPVVVYSFRDQVEKISRPRIHYNNGVLKNQATDGRYKPTVRMFKNWAYNHFGDDRDIISSFKVESLVHGGNNEHFYDDRPGTFIVLGSAIEKLVRARNLLPTILRSVCGHEDISANWQLPGKTQFVTQLQASLGHALAAYHATSEEQAAYNWKKTFNL